MKGLLLVCVLVLGACDAAHEAADGAAGDVSGDGGVNWDTGGLPLEKPTISFHPPDLSTSIDAGTAGVQVLSSSTKVTDEQKTALASSLSLRTWPDLAPMPAGTSITDLPTEHLGYGDHFDVGITPADPMEEGWYFLSLREVPPAYSLWYQHVIIAPDGSAGVRFRVGSEPLLLGIDVCPKGGDKSRLYFHFSEPITATKAVDGIVTILQSAETFQGCDGAPYDDYDLYFDCVGLDMAQPLTISVSEGVQSKTGVAMKDLTGATTFSYSFTPSSLPEVTTGCGYYRPEESLFDSK